MTSKAYAENDFAFNGVRIAITRHDRRQILKFAPVTVGELTEQSSAVPDDDVWLRLPEDDARALYEALANHFGHAGHDIRALRKDYDAERARVDRLIDYATKERA